MKTIHNAMILDRSGSMAGAKYEAATSGVLAEIKEMEKHKGELNVTQTVIEFNDDEVTEHAFMMPSANLKDISFKGAASGTPLYRTVELVIKKLLKHVNKGEKVLIKIFTDGQDTTSYDPSKLKVLIDLVEELHEFTITFEGTKFDGEKVQREMGIKAKNMYFHQNTADSIKMSGNVRSRSTAMYMSAVEDGLEGAELQSRGFYSPDQGVAQTPEEPKP